MIALSETTRTTGALERLSDEGISIWLDGLSRKRSGAANLAERAGCMARGGCHHHPVDLPGGHRTR